MRVAVELIGAPFKLRDPETEEGQMMWFRRGHPAAKMTVEDEPLASEGSSPERLAFTAGRVARLPRDPDLRVDYALALLAAQPRQAAVEAQKAAELDKKGDPALLIRAAMVLVATRDLDPARACAERARLRVERTAEASPRHTVIVNKLSHVRGQIAMLEHDDDLAEQMLGNAYRADPLTPSTASGIAGSHSKSGVISSAKNSARWFVSTPWLMASTTRLTTSRFACDIAYSSRPRSANARWRIEYSKSS